MPIDLDAIRAAHDRIRPHIHRTPVLTCARLSAECGGKIFFKCENLQKIGAFKARGATNAVFALSEVAALRGVVTHSSGNHGAAVARAAKLRGIPAHIVMPSNSAKPKIRAVEAYGGKITLCEPTQAARETACNALLEKTLGTLIHPFEDELVMAGQGTAAIELLEDVPDLDLILAPVGGGGLLSGTAIAAKALRPAIKIIGTEPAGADDAARSFRAHQRIPLTHVDTIADGLRTTIGELNFDIVQHHVDDIVTVSEAGIIAAMRLIWEAVKIIVEPSAAVPYAAILERRFDPAHQRIGLILSGGNVDLDKLPWMER
ncbi:MAG: pyridoxal-phosphate dependent enzyme [Verrucomicrobia bacterium]|nr:pyridoxal-phosphate dependent enzyme [Verrucomicrobiota bacterium]